MACVSLDVMSLKFLRGFTEGEITTERDVTLSLIVMSDTRSPVLVLRLTQVPVDAFRNLLMPRRRLVMRFAPWATLALIALFAYPTTLVAATTPLADSVKVTWHSRLSQ